MFQSSSSKELLAPCFPHPEFDVELSREVVERIHHKNPGIDSDKARELAVTITTITGFLCSAFEHHFIDEMDALVGSPEYSLRVFMSRNGKRTVD